MSLKKGIFFGIKSFIREGTKKNLRSANCEKCFEASNVNPRLFAPKRAAVAMILHFKGVGGLV